MFSFLMFVGCSFVGWLFWYRDYQRRMAALRKKYLPNTKFRYEPSRVFPWRYGTESAETLMGIRFAANRLARRFARLERLKEDGVL